MIRMTIRMMVPIPMIRMVILRLGLVWSYLTEEQGPCRRRLTSRFLTTEPIGSHFWIRDPAAEKGARQRPGHDCPVPENHFLRFVRRRRYSNIGRSFTMWKLKTIIRRADGRVGGTLSLWEIEVAPGCGPFEGPEMHE